MVNSKVAPHSQVLEADRGPVTTSDIIRDDKIGAVAVGRINDATGDTEDTWEAVPLDAGNDGAVSTLKPPGQVSHIMQSCEPSLSLNSLFLRCSLRKVPQGQISQCLVAITLVSLAMVPVKLESSRRV